MFATAAPSGRQCEGSENLELRHTNRFYMVRRLAALVGGLRAPTLRFHFGISGRGSAPLRSLRACVLAALARLLTDGN